MTRRQHKKSRKGCLQCKQRHIKCDESRPACLLCISGEKRCSFLSNLPYSTSSPSEHIRSGRTSVSTATPIVSVATVDTVESCSPKPIGYEEQGIVNMVHLDLLYHARVTLWSDDYISLDPESRDELRETIIGYALQSPYLMHEVLALSAMHLSTQHVSQKSFYQHQATELQTCALSLFNRATDDGSTSSIATRFLFASLLGLQVLHETLVFRPNDFGHFLEKFAGYLRLTQGVTLQTQGGNWQALHETGLRTLLRVGARLPPEDNANAPECDALEKLLRSADLGPSSMKVYERAINQLRALHQLQRPIDSASLIFSWPITIPIEFADLIMQRRPDALLVLAHYAGMLHQHRHLWVVGNGGLYMIESIRSYIGQYWHPGLAWPLSILESS